MGPVDQSAFGDFTHVDQRSTAEMIAEQLRNAILHGRLNASEQLSEVDLATRFGVSRGPIREALQRLMEEGLLKRARNRGVFVVAFDQFDVRDIYATRAAIESAAAEQILQGDVDELIASLAECCEAMREAAEAANANDQTRADIDFHTKLVEASGSPRLVKIERTLLIESQISMTALDTRYAEPMASLAEHTAIVDAFRQRNPALIRETIHEHMLNAVRMLTTQN